MARNRWGSQQTMMPRRLRLSRPAAKESTAGWQHLATWVGVGTALIAAIGALTFNGISAMATSEQIALSRDQADLARQGQLTERYAQAVEELGAPSTDVRLGGIYALERLMHDSPKDQPTIVEVLAAFLRNKLNGRSAPIIRPTGVPAATEIDGGNRLDTDIRAALSVLGRRDINDDPPNFSVDLSDVNFGPVDLNRMYLKNMNLARANLIEAKLDLAVLAGADLRGARLSGAFLGGANLAGAWLTRADFSYTQLILANFNGASMDEANLSNADLNETSLTGAHLDRARLTRVEMTGGTLAGATLTEADLRGAELERVNVTDADFLFADIDMMALRQVDVSSARNFGISRSSIPGTPSLKLSDPRVIPAPANS